jgi:hypothetical protein
VHNVIENGHHKRRDSPLMMFLCWMGDHIPHFYIVDKFFWNGDTRTSAEKMIRVFVFTFYTFLLILILYAYQHKKSNLLHMAFYILFVYISDVFFFFIQIHNMSIEQYTEMKKL